MKKNANIITAVAFVFIGGILGFHIYHTDSAQDKKGTIKMETSDLSCKIDTRNAASTNITKQQDNSMSNLIYYGNSLTVSKGTHFQIDRSSLNNVTENEKVHIFIFNQVTEEKEEIENVRNENDIEYIVKEDGTFRVYEAIEKESGEITMNDITNKVIINSTCGNTPDTPVYCK